MFSTEECRICFRTKQIKNLIELPCRHFYCPVCIYLWESKTKKCPTCRKFLRMDKESDTKNHPLIIFVHLLQNLKSCTSAIDIYTKFMEGIHEFMVLSRFSKKQQKKLRNNIFKFHEKEFNCIRQYSFLFENYIHDPDYRLHEMRDFHNVLFGSLMNIQVTDNYKFVEIVSKLFHIYYFKMIFHFRFRFQEYYMYLTEQENILKNIFD